MASPRSRAKPAAASTETPVSTGPALSLAAVIAATVAGNFLYTPAAFHESLIASGDVEINPEMKDEHGSIATRATAKHINQGNTQMTETATPAAAKPKFEIEAGIEIPQRTRVSTGLRAGRAPVYPFEQLEIGQSFFVPNASADKPAAKAMASTVAGANARYVEEIAGQTRVNRKGKTVPATNQLRKFKIFDTERTLADGTVQKGARIFRVALTDSAAA